MVASGVATKVLVTGGAGFIGSHVADRLLAGGFAVRALDNLDAQVHPEGERPAYLDPEVELVIGDVRDRAAIRRALDDVEAVIHLAAAVGVGQSMYEPVGRTRVSLFLAHSDPAAPLHSAQPRDRSDGRPMPAYAFLPG